MFYFDSLLSHSDGFNNVDFGIGFSAGHPSNNISDCFWTLDLNVACDNSIPTSCLCCWLDFDYLWTASTVLIAVDHDFGWTLDTLHFWMYQWTNSSLEDNCDDD